MRERFRTCQGRLSGSVSTQPMCERVCVLVHFIDIHLLLIEASLGWPDVKHRIGYVRAIHTENEVKGWLVVSVLSSAGSAKRVKLLSFTTKSRNNEDDVG